MTITGDLSTRDFKDIERKGGPCVVTCYSDDDLTIKRMAQIFDALDNPLMGDPNCDLRPRETCVECMDCTARADLDYAMEAAVYEGFSAPGNEKFKHIVPTYHGSWTFALPTHQAGKPRWVRMVLMEHCEGEVMDKIMGKQVIPKDDDDDDDYREPNNKYTLDYGKLPPEADRLSIMKQIIETEIRMMWNVEISITPCNARLQTENIFVCNDGSVKLITFREAKVYRYLDETEDHPNQIYDGRWDLGVPAAEMRPMKSPIERYWSKCFLEPFGRWLPEAWEKNEELANEWLIDTFGS
ncbi:hypothetical protein QC762_408400 [Podospora pseudocomata]|uniref:Protein kinase domain-containing protein n=1 Tax=Podospora pseudocomata TaxID=2093779 RepID=A0ABR0GFY3_9PEZI|nr:hypothetical protein QC762_408400 [Podospora pseudocomata]